MIQANAHAPKTKPTTVQNTAERPRRIAISAVSGASEASITSDVAIMFAGLRWVPARMKPEVIPRMVAIVVIIGVIAGAGYS